MVFKMFKVNVKGLKCDLRENESNKDLLHQIKIQFVFSLFFVFGSLLCFSILNLNHAVR